MSKYKKEITNITHSWNELNYRIEDIRKYLKNGLLSETGCYEFMKVLSDFIKHEG